MQQVIMYNISKMHIILFKIIISNVIIVYTSNELSQNTEKITSITSEDLNKLIRRYPTFIQLTLKKQNYYTGKNVSRCPTPYNENTLLDDPEVEGTKLFNPRKCRKPWTWTYNNYIDVSVPINGTIGKKLGIVIQPCLRENTDIIPCYTHYLNVMESVGLTLIDRFCLFVLEIIDRVNNMDDNVDFMEEYSLFDVTVDYSTLGNVGDQFNFLYNSISIAFQLYYISTLPLDCVVKAMKKFTSMVNMFNTYSAGDIIEECCNIFTHCRGLMKSKLNYAVLENDESWEWDITSVNKPDDSLIIHTQLANFELGLRLFKIY